MGNEIAIPAFSNLPRAVRDRFHSSSVKLPSLLLSSPTKTFIPGVVGMVTGAVAGAAVGAVGATVSPDRLASAVEDRVPVDNPELADADGLPVVLFFATASNSSAVRRPSPLRSSS